MSQKILFIVEENFIKGKSYLGTSNDCLLIFTALKQKKEIYLISPDSLIKQSQKKHFLAGLSEINFCEKFLGNSFFDDTAKYKIKEEQKSESTTKYTAKDNIYNIPVNAIKLSSNLNIDNIDKSLVEAFYVETINTILNISSNINKEFLESELSEIKRNFQKTTTFQERLTALVEAKNNLKKNSLFKSSIFLKNATEQKIDISKIPIFNRSEPTSLNDNFYEILINLKKNNVFINPDPEINKIAGDKTLIYSIHHNKKIFGINFAKNLSAEDLKKGKNKISFDSKFIKIGTDKLSFFEILEFYKKLDKNCNKKFADLFEKTDLENIVKILYPKITKKNNKYQKIIAELTQFRKGIFQYIKFHNVNLNKDSVLKPAFYFGGTGIIIVKNTKINFFTALQNIKKTFFAIKNDCEKQYLKNVKLNYIIIQRRANRADLGDLRILLSGGNLQGIFARVNSNYINCSVNNIHHGGHIESLFRKYPITHHGTKKLTIDCKKEGLKIIDDEYKKIQALDNLLHKISILKKIEPLKTYAIIGVDALLTQISDNNKVKYEYFFNEINLTSPMGQNQLLILDFLTQNNSLIIELMLKLSIIKRQNITKYQLVNEYFKKNSLSEILIFKKKLLQNTELKKSIIKSIQEKLKNNYANQTLEFLFNQFKNFKNNKI